MAVEQVSPEVDLNIYPNLVDEVIKSVPEDESVKESSWTLAGGLRGAPRLLARGFNLIIDKYIYWRICRELKDVRYDRSI